MKRIIVFGSGTAHGYWDVQGGWSQRLRTVLDQRSLDTQGSDHFELYNLGIRGEDSGTVLDRFGVEMENRYAEDAEHTVIFQFGANDAMFVYEEDDLLHSPRRFRKNIEHLIEEARDSAENIIFLGLIPVDDEEIDPIPSIEGRSYSTNRMDEYNDIIGEVCEEKGVDFIDLFELFESEASESLLEDGLHPNSEGHRLIFEKVRRHLAQKEII